MMAISETVAARAAKWITDDLQGRSGIGNAWDEIDPEIKQEIIKD